MEKEGTMTNAERRISRLERLVNAPGEALPDAEIICRFARAMGFKGFDFRSMAEIFNEHAALTAGTNIDYSGLNYDILRERRSVQWPFPKSAVAEGKHAALQNGNSPAVYGSSVSHKIRPGHYSQRRR
jgi:ferredoxin-nitrate reductase